MYYAKGHKHRFVYDVSICHAGVPFARKIQTNNVLKWLRVGGVLVSFGCSGVTSTLLKRRVLKLTNLYYCRESGFSFVHSGIDHNSYWYKLQTGV